MHCSACAALAILMRFAGPVEAGFPFFDAFEEKASSAASSPVVAEDIDSLSEPAGEILGGTIDALLGRSDISWSERQCLSNSASQFATSLTEACDEALKSYKAFTAPPSPPAAMYQPVALTTPLPASGTAMQAFATIGATTLGPLPAFGASALTPTSVASSRRLRITEGEEAVISMGLVASLSNLYKTQTQLAKSCLKADVVSKLQEISEHLTNATYVGERLVGNGVDIVTETSKAFTSYEHQNYRAFGKDMGTMWRAVLLSKPDEGGAFRTPSTQSIQDATDGLFSSLLGHGFTLHVSSDEFGGIPASPFMGAQAPHGQSILSSSVTTATVMPGATQQLVNPSEVDIDLHDCVVGNMPLWRSAWTPVFDLASDMCSASGELPSSADFMSSFMDVQLALKKCDIGPTKEAMLLDTFESGGKFKAKLGMPDAKPQTGAVPSYLSTALEDFKERNWHAFGSQLGKAMQSMVVSSFPQEYEIDDTGRLRKLVIEATEVRQTSTAWKEGTTVGVCFGLMLVVFSILSLLVAVRSRRSMTTMARLSSQDSDLEAIVE